MNQTLEAFFDGDCPLCLKEVALLRKLDRKERIRWTDIASPDFDASSYGKTQEEFMAKMHGRLPDGAWIEGVEVFRLGVTPTPAVAFEASRLGAMGAVISASHNPFHDNGIKLFAVGGTKLGDDVEQAIEHELAHLGVPTAEPAAIHGRRDPEPYIAHLLSVLDGRDLRPLKVVVDAANGAASHIVADVLELFPLGLACESVNTVTCQPLCNSAADCPGGYTCYDADMDGTSYCINPTCN